jgi:hypothetical protein
MQQRPSSSTVSGHVQHGSFLGGSLVSRACLLGSVLLGSVLLGAGLFGCGEGDGQTRASAFPGVRPAGTPAPSTLVGNTTATLDLSPFFPASSQLVGVAVSPNGDRYVLDEKTGLHRLGDAGTELIMDSSSVQARYGLSPALEFTDVVAFGAHRFLITAENDGFLLDLDAESMQPYFCYLPSVSPSEEQEREQERPRSISQALQASGVAVKQRTESVTVNPLTGQIFAQPRTLRLDSELTSAGSELFVFEPGQAEPVGVMPLLDPNFVAGGMLPVESRLLLGFGNGLYELVGDEPELVRALDAGVVITGMARDVDGSLLVLDGPARRLLSVQSFTR